jgi:hypothetical protein
MLGTLAGWRAYALARGNNAPTAAADADALAALTRASDYIQFFYIDKFLAGYDATSTNVVEAAYEAANYELTTPLFFTTSYTPAQQKVLTKVASIQWTPVAGNLGDEWALATPTIGKISAMLSNYMPGKYLIGMTAVGPNYD